MSPRKPMKGDKAMTLTAFRLPVELVAQIDRFAEQLSERTGATILRAEAARVLLAAGLRAEATTAKGRGRKS